MSKKPLDITSIKSLREHGIIATDSSFRVADPEKAVREGGKRMMEYLSTLKEQGAPMKLKYKLCHPKAKDPVPSSEEDNLGVDLHAAAIKYEQWYVEYDTGVAVEIPPGHKGFIYARSSISNTDFFMPNGVGVIENDYRGTIRVRLKTITGANGKRYQVGDRICQLVIQKCESFELERVEELTETQRGSGGFGSTGR